MAHFKFNEIIYIDGGNVQPNNSLMYYKICKTMVDTEEMQQFVSFSGLYGFYEFFRECFSEQGADGNSTDKLVHIKQQVRDRNIKKILDYGAGKGRFFKLIADIQDIEYHALEIEEKYHEELEQLLQSSGRLYTTPEDIPIGEFDAVLLINTLHEIPFDQWKNVLAIIKRSLAIGGCLFFCETVPLITGEYIENTGFLVLGASEQTILFGATAEYLDDKRKLHFSIVERESIPDLTSVELKDTLSKLKDSSFQNWEHEQSSEEKNARNTAYYAVQHLNAEKALKQLSNTSDNTDSITMSNQSNNDNPVVGKDELWM